MTGGGNVGFLRANEAPPEATATDDWKQWEVDFARFFNFPPSEGAPAVLRRPAKGKIRSRGAWLIASSRAFLVVLKPAAAAAVPPAPVLSVSVPALKIVIESHFVSTMDFTWPQLACRSQCPFKGSKVVFLGYRGVSNQVQKFAVRFATGSDAESFMNFVTECSRSTTDIALLASDLICENSCVSELMSSTRHHCRIDDESSYEAPVGEMPYLNVNEENPNSCRYPVLAESNDTLYTGFPPSFTDLISSCSSDTGKEQRKNIPEPDLTSEIGGQVSDPSCHDDSKQMGSISEADLKCQILKYISDTNFHDMLSKLDKVINDLGGDLSL